MKNTALKACALRQLFGEIDSSSDDDDEELFPIGFPSDQLCSFPRPHFPSRKLCKDDDDKTDALFSTPLTLLGCRCGCHKRNCLEGLSINDVKYVAIKWLQINFRGPWKTTTFFLHYT